MSTTKQIGRPVWAEVSLDAIAHNLSAVHRHLSLKADAEASRGSARAPKILAVVKSNAYGLGAVPVAKALQKAGADWFGVTCGNEGMELRESGIQRPILVLTGFWPGEESRLIESGLTPAVIRLDDLRHLERAARTRLARRSAKRSRARSVRGPVKFHLKINSGMNRLGISPGEIEAFGRELAECRHLQLEGTFTHFASSEDFEKRQTEDQEREFRACLDRMRELGLDPGIVHMANSAAICARPSTWAHMVRPGAILYGYYQTFDPPGKQQEVLRELRLEPALALRARVVSLREIASGDAVGYSARFVASRPSRIAVINAGYADGMMRARTNRGCVLVRGKFAPLVGTISMDLTTIDVTDVPGAAVGDIVTIYGRDGQGEILVSKVAREIGTVTSELLCAVGRRVARHYA